MFAFGTRLVFEELAERVKFPAGVSASPTVNAIAPVGVSSQVDWLVTLEIDGGVLLPMTDKIPVVLVEVCPSGFVIVTVRAPPGAPPEIVKFSVRFVGLL